MGQHVSQEQANHNVGSKRGHHCEVVAEHRHVLTINKVDKVASHVNQVDHTPANVFNHPDSPGLDEKILNSDDVTIVYETSIESVDEIVIEDDSNSSLPIACAQVSRQDSAQQDTSRTAIQKPNKKSGKNKKQPVQQGFSKDSSLLCQEINELSNVVTNKQEKSQQKLEDGYSRYINGSNIPSTGFVILKTRISNAVYSSQEKPPQQAHHSNSIDGSTCSLQEKAVETPKEVSMRSTPQKKQVSENGYRCQRNRNKISSNGLVGFKQKPNARGPSSRKKTGTTTTCEHCNQKIKKTTDKPKNLFWSSTGKKFFARFQYSRRGQQHLPLRPKTKPPHIKCLKCDKTFWRPCHLSNHVLVHHADENPQMLQQCLPAKPKPANKEYIHKCSKCEKTFSRPCHLRNHILARHATENPRQVLQHLPPKSAHKLHKCEQCARTFSASSVLKRHVLTHNKQKPYVCVVCKRSYKHLSSLQRHARDFHRSGVALSFTPGYDS